MSRFSDRGRQGRDRARPGAVRHLLLALPRAFGNGLGMIVRRGFKQPPSYHIDRLREAPVGHFYDVISNGYGAMLNYAAQVQPRDRWAIVAYIRALQYSENANINDLPAEARARVPAAGTGPRGPRRRTSRLCPPTPTLWISRRNPQRPPEFRARAARAQCRRKTPGVNQKDNDDDGTKLRNRPATGGYAEEISADRDVRRAHFPRDVDQPAISFRVRSISFAPIWWVSFSGSAWAWAAWLF